MRIVITGSLAYDHIMDFPGYFNEHILADRLPKINVSFLVSSLKKLRGGCASNIAYSLALLGESPWIMGTVGEDFGEYRTWLESNGVVTDLIRVIPGEFTASCFVTTDRDNNQITGFYPGAMRYAHTLSFQDVNPQEIHIAVISANDPEAMNKYAKECKEFRIPYVYDPGHQIPRLSPEELLFGIKGSEVTIVNSYELGMIGSRTGLSEAEIARQTNMLIVTYDSKGSVIRTNGSVHKIPPARADRVVDPTGAGDAYRAGILKGILHGYSHEEMGLLASVAAVYVVESVGTNTHAFTREEFEKRFKENFSKSSPLALV
ncbi:MAG: carbohydrate kinase family protein [Armatimonadetes bacterium]|nr:carbohydrate kinase family protein [Armatimonadota bacterium]